MDEWERLIDMFPRDASDILERVRRGRFDVNLQHRRLDAIINRLVCGILTAALFMGSAQLWSRATPPLLYGISVFGALGCIASGIFAAWLMLEIRRSSKIDSRDR